MNTVPRKPAEEELKQELKFAQHRVRSERIYAEAQRAYVDDLRNTVAKLETRLKEVTDARDFALGRVDTLTITNKLLQADNEDLKARAGNAAAA